MLKAIQADWNNKWILEQIEWIEDYYDGLSKVICKCKQQLTIILNLESPSSHKLYAANS